MNDQQKAVLLKVLLTPDVVVIESVTDLSDAKLAEAVNDHLIYRDTTVRWLGNNMAVALSALTQAFPTAPTPVIWTNKRDLARVQGIAHSHEQWWVNLLFDQGKLDELRSLLLALAMAVKHFGEGERDEALRAALTTFVENAITADFREGVERCLHCTWQRRFTPDSDLNRLEDATEAEQDAWWANIKATNFHDADCGVPAIRIRLGITNPANPRSIYPDDA